MGRKTLWKVRKHRRQPIAIAERTADSLPLPHFHQLQGSLSQPFPENQAHAGRLNHLVLGVPPHIARHQIHAAIAIEITDGQTVPKTGVILETPRLGDVLKATALIEKTPQRSPLQGKHQIAVAIVVDIHKHRPTHPPQIAEWHAPVVGHHQGSVIVPQAHRRRGFGKPPWNSATGYKPIEVAVLIHVCQHNGSHAEETHRKHRRCDRR